MTDLYDELEFPRRAEYVDQYDNYKVDISHWRALAKQFQRAFRGVFTRKDAAVLLVYGPQGAGKSMFCRRLKADYERTRSGLFEPDLDNLWHVLVATDSPTAQNVESATTDTALQLVDEYGAPDWHGELSAFARNDRSRVRVFLFDDAQRMSIMRPWTDLSSREFHELDQLGQILPTVAERINYGCRREFQRSIFVFMSNDRPWIDALRGHLDKWFKELVSVLELPAPEPEVIERIVRINTNRLNRVSYWYCLDNATEDGRKDVRRAFVEKRPFTESFQAVSQSLDGQARRKGRPGNPNVLTLVTLGSEFAVIEAFLKEREIDAEPEHGESPRHIGIWGMRGPWGSKILMRPKHGDKAFTRRARMLESEFMLRWVNLDMVATAVLLTDTMNMLDESIASLLMDIVLWRPSIGTPRSTRESRREDCGSLESQLESLSRDTKHDEFMERFRGAGQQRSVDYEQGLRRPFGELGFKPFGRGFAVYGSLRPDLIVSGAAETGEYRPCSLTSAKSDDEIASVIRRTGHCVEFTSFLRENLDGLEEYLKDKIERYAAMLESV